MKPGNIVFTCNCAPAGSPMTSLTDGSFVFQLGDQTEVLRLDPDGTFWVRGVRVEKNADVYQGFREWLAHARVSFAPKYTVIGGGGSPFVS